MKSKNLIVGIILIALGAFIIYWAQTHSPNAGIGKMITNELSGSYTMSETWYYVSMVGGTVIGIIGILRAFKAMK